MLRAYAIDYPDPGEVLERTNTALTRLLPEALATAVYAVLDPGTGELVYANAGHLPPLVATGAGEVRLPRRADRDHARRLPRRDLHHGPPAASRRERPAQLHRRADRERPPRPQPTAWTHWPASCGGRPPSPPSRPAPRCGTALLGTDSGTTTCACSPPGSGADGPDCRRQQAGWICACPPAHVPGYAHRAQGSERARGQRTQPGRPAARFRHLTRDWFAGAFASRRRPRRRPGGRSAGENTLVVAPTGSGKTLAAFLWAIDKLAAAPAPADPKRRSRVLYISPLKALAVDIERNLRAPLTGIRHAAHRLGLDEPDIAVAVRTGDTAAEERRKLASKPPDILITTPESLFLLLTSQARETLRGVETVIVDEVHAVAGNKRGAHLALSLERLDALRAGRAAPGPRPRPGRGCSSGSGCPRRSPRRWPRSSAAPAR